MLYKSGIMPPKKSLIKITVQVNEDKISIISGSAENTHLSISAVELLNTSN